MQIHKFLFKAMALTSLSLLAINTISPQELIAGDFLIERTAPFRYVITARIYYDSTVATGPDSMIFVIDGANRDTVALDSTEVLTEYDATLFAYRLDWQFIGGGPHYIRLEGREDTIGIDADNYDHPIFTLSTILSNRLFNQAALNAASANWSNHPLDYEIDEAGNLRWYNVGQDDGDGWVVGYALSSTLDGFYHSGSYHYPTARDSLLIDPTSGEVLWLSPRQPGKYLLGVELIEFSPFTTAVIDQYSRYLLVEIKPEDIVSSTSGAPAPLERALTLFPNPARDRVRIAVPPALASGPSELTIYNAAGARMYRRSFAAPPEGEVLEIATQGWPAGVYSVAWRVGEEMHTARLVVDR